MTMRPEVSAVAADLLAKSVTSKAVTIDEVGEALGGMRVDPTEIEALLVALEAAGRSVIVPTGATGIASLKVVLPATRALTIALGRKPHVDEIASKSGLSAADVRRALLLAQVMGRGR